MFTRNTDKIALASCLMALAGAAQAKLGGFETADGYSTPFTHDVWMYDAGQTGAPFTPSFYNTGRWAELFGSSNAGGDSGQRPGEEPGSERPVQGTDVLVLDVEVRLLLFDVPDPPAGRS